MQTKDNLESELSRELSLFHITMMGLGMMIGAGVFLGIGNAIYFAGPGGVILTFALNGLLALFTAMSYGELSSAIPRAGGAYNFARIGFGRGTSFVAGWMEWFASSVAGSMYAITFSIYTLRYFDQIGFLEWLPAGSADTLVKPCAVLVAMLFIYINYRGASETGKIGAIMTLGQTLFLVIIGLTGIYVAIKDPERLKNFEPFLPYGWNKLLITMGFTYVAFEGFEVIAQAGDEAIDPKQNLPKAMLYSVYIAAMTYIAVAFAALIAVKAGSQGIDIAPWQWVASFKEKGFGEAVARLLPMGNFLLTLAVIFAATSALNATVYSATRASYALGRDKMLPSIFSKISKKRKTPWGALTLTGAIVIIVAALLPTMDVASSASIMFLSLFFLVNICAIKIRLNMGDELKYGYLMPLFPVFPVTAIIFQLILAVWLVHMSLIAWIVAPAWILGGLLIYHTYSKSRALPSEDEIHILEEEILEEPPSDDFKVMIPVANPKNALSLVGNTIKLSKKDNSSIQLLHMVKVPDQIGLRDAREYMLEGKEGIIEAMLYLNPLFPVSTTIRYCRNTARGIISAIREKRINLLIMGWHGKRKSSFFKIGSTVDPVISRSPCDIIILKDCANKTFKNILVPICGDDNDFFAIETAKKLADKGASLDLLIFNNKNDVIEKANEEITKDFNITTETAYNKDFIKTVLGKSADYDLIVSGYADNFLNKTLHEKSTTIAEKFNGAVALVKKTKGIKSFTRRFL